MIEIRCKFCHKLNAEVGDDTRGRLKMKCKKCLRWIDLELPIAAVAPSRRLQRCLGDLRKNVPSGGNNSVALMRFS